MKYIEIDLSQTQNNTTEGSETREIVGKQSKATKTKASDNYLSQSSIGANGLSVTVAGQYTKLYTNALVQIMNTATQGGFKKTIKDDILILFVIIWQQCMSNLKHLNRSQLDDFFSDFFYASYSHWSCADIDSCVDKIKKEYLAFKSSKPFSRRGLIYFDEESCVCLLLPLKFDSYGNYVVIKEQSCGFNLRNMDNVTLKHKSLKLNTFVGSFCKEYLEYIRGRGLFLAGN